MQPCLPEELAQIYYSTPTPRVGVKPKGKGTGLY